MPATPSVHDNIVYFYSVDCRGRRVILHTSFPDRDPKEYTDVVFDDVIAHYFEHALPGNILFDVEEVDVAVIVQDNAQLLTDSWRYGWPPVEYNGDLSALIAALKASSVHAYQIAASLGLTGWVLAGNCKRVSRASPASLT